MFNLITFIYAFYRGQHVEVKVELMRDTDNDVNGFLKKPGIRWSAFQQQPIAFYQAVK